MSEQQLADDLPARPRSAFAAAPEDPERAKDGRKLGGATNPRFSKEYWTEERRQEQSERAKEMIKSGTFGAKNGFHRRKTKSFQEIATEHAQQRADEMVKKLDAMIFDQQKDKRLQLEAMREYMKMETWTHQNAREDEKLYRSMTNQQLDSALLDVLGEALGLDLSGIVDAEVVEDVIAELPAGEEVDDGDD